MSEQNKDKLNRDEWLKNDTSADQSAGIGFSKERTPEDWEAIAARGRAQLSDEQDAADLLADIDRTIEDRFGSPEVSMTSRRKKGGFRWPAVAAAALLLIVAGWWLWSGPSGSEALYKEYFAHLEDDLRVSLMGDQEPDALSIALKPYKERNYTAATQSMALYLEQHPQEESLRLYYGISLLGSDQAEEAIGQLRQFRNANGNSNYTTVINWYLALAYLRNEQLVEARQLLVELAGSQNPYSTRAASLLEAL